MPYRLKQNTDVLRTWHNLPPMVTVPGVGDVHCIESGWASGDFLFERFMFETVEYEAPADPPLEPVKASLKVRVNDDAERTRLLYITPGAGMAMTYIEKHNQACAVCDLGEVAANDLTEAERNDQFPTISASVGIEAATLWGCAQLVRARYEAFADMSAVIERTRLLGKKNISDASDAASAQAAYEAITWPSP